MDSRRFDPQKQVYIKYMLFTYNNVCFSMAFPPYPAFPYAMPGLYMGRGGGGRGGRGGLGRGDFNNWPAWGGGWDNQGWQGGSGGRGGGGAGK